MLLSHYYDGLVEAGCDEAGRGCLAGSVYAAAVILPPDYENAMLNDSKQLTEHRRYELRTVIERDAVAWAVGIVTPAEIDRINILNASILAMHRALDGLKVRPEAIIVDGNRFKPYREPITNNREPITNNREPITNNREPITNNRKPITNNREPITNNREPITNNREPIAIPYTTIVKGDGKYLSIAAASILAKTYRDDYMNALHQEYPQYDWDKNKGYPTLRHREAIRQYGTTPYHRLSYNLLGTKELELEFL